LECGDLSPLSFGLLANPWRLRSLGTPEQKRRQVAALQISRFPNSPGVFQQPARFLLRGFRRPREVASLALGKLERQVLEEAWRRGEVSVRDIYVAFQERIAYTTLMTTLDRLFRKQILDRRKGGRAFFYSPAMSREEFEHGIREDVIDGLLGGGAEGIQPVLACIVDTVSETDRELLDELDRLIKEKRRGLRRKTD
jgi:predicted transcriptional regulator